MFGKKKQIEPKPPQEEAAPASERPAPKPVPKMGFDPAFTPTCIIDLKKVVHSIHESKGQTPAVDDSITDPKELLDVIAEEAHLLRQGKASPEAIAPIMMDRLGYEETSVFGQATRKISQLAGELADQPTYHNPQHITEVILAAFSLGLREHLPKDRVAELVIAAAAHDLGHTGGVNETPYALETRSYEIAYPVLKESGVSEKIIDRIGQMILATDFANGVPVVRENYLHLKEQGEPADSEAMMQAAQSLILTEADILFSCFSETYNELLSNLLSVEWKKGRNLSFQERIGFLQSVKFVSEAATQLGLEQRRLEIIDRLKKKSDSIPPSSG